MARRDTIWEGRGKVTEVDSDTVLAEWHDPDANGIHSHTPTPSGEAWLLDRKYCY